MTRKQSLRVKELVHDVARDYGLLRDVLFNAPQMATYNRAALENISTRLECKLVAINCVLIRGGAA